MHRVLPLVACLLVITAPACAFSLDPILGASSDEHVWLIVEHEDPAQGVRLLHQPLQAEGDVIQTVMSLPRIPAAITAWSDRLWLVFETAEAGDSASEREAFTVQIRREPTTELFVLTPRDRLGVVASLPGEGRLAGLAATADGPLALIVPSRATRAGSLAEVARPRLLQLRSDAWVERDLPALGASREWWLLTGGDRGQFVSILSDDPEQRRAAIAWTLGADERWTQTPLDLDLERVATVGRVDRQALLVDAPDEDQLRLCYLRPGRLVVLAETPRPRNDWAALGTIGDVRLFERDGDDITMRIVDPVSGVIGDRVVLSKPAPSTRVWYVSVLLAITIMALLFAFVVRPGSTAAAVSLPSNQVILGLSSRLVALLLDLFPGALLSVLVLGCRLTDLAAMPLATATPEETAPYLLMVLITFVHTTLSELMTARTLGKALVGARVATIAGARPGAVPILIRNVLKMVTLVIPPLAVIVVFNPNLQGLGDVLARTVVVHETEQPETKDR